MTQDKHPYMLFLQVLFVMLLISLNSYSQVKIKRQKYVSFGFNAGVIGWSPTRLNNISGSAAFARTGNYGLGDVEDVSGHKSLALIANTSVGLHAGFLWHDKKSNNCTAIQVEVQNNKACYEFNSPFGFPSHGDTARQWIEADKYVKYSIALQRCWYTGESALMGGNSFFYIRESFGQTLLHRNLGEPYTHLIKANYSEDWTENGTGMRSNIVSVNQNTF